MAESKNRERANQITFRLNNEELNELRRKMELLGIKNRELFIRKIIQKVTWCILI